MSQPGKYVPLVVFVVAFCLAAASAMAADESPLSPIGLRAGLSLRGEDISQYDLFLTRMLPWTRPLDSGWNLKSAGELDVSLLHRKSNQTVGASVSMDLLLSSPADTLTCFSGLGAGLLGDSSLGDYDFGGPFFILFHAGVRLQLNPRTSLGYRYSHQSNAHIYTKNPSLNLHQIELRISF